MIEEAARIPGRNGCGDGGLSSAQRGRQFDVCLREGTDELRPSKAVAFPKYFSVSPGYFTAAGTRLLSGRDFDWQDGASTRKLAIINETFAGKMFGNLPAVGPPFCWRRQDPL
jgi:hypothetical protein